VLVPGINYALMLYLCLAQSLPREPSAPKLYRPSDVEQIASAALGVGAGVAIALAMVGISVKALGSYGSALFLLTPTVMGAATGYIYNRRNPHSGTATLSLALLTVLIGGGVFLLNAVEGAVCLVMAFPLALGSAAIGAFIGQAIAAADAGTPLRAALVLLALPLFAGVGALPSPSPLYEVVSSIEIDATPERVWENVVGFGELPPPTELLFASGVAYPIHARIEGSGVGAIRRCEFSTGAFVEPITRWDAPNVLAFDVASQPPPMEEWSPYGPIVTPHLNGYFRSVRGEFRLVPLAAGRTRLEGSTWYELDLFPRAYWNLWSHAFIARIHARVLAHVKRLSEADSLR
jgi:hypothetical protein